MEAIAIDPQAFFWQTVGNAGASGGGIRQRLLERAEEGGVAKERVVLTNTTNIIDFVRRCALADIVLDTSPISGHTVAMDVLWAGTPLLTRPGEAFSSRVASSVLAALNLDTTLTTRTRDDFIKLAQLFIKGKRGRRRREEVRRHIEAVRWSAPLFHRQQQVESVERAVQLMREVYLAALPPWHIILATLSPISDKGS